jgi:16S rRNA (cytosine1402-N4)-methyltransferase
MPWPTIVMPRNEPSNASTVWNAVLFVVTKRPLRALLGAARVAPRRARRPTCRRASRGAHARARERGRLAQETTTGDGSGARQRGGRGGAGGTTREGNRGGGSWIASRVGRTWGGSPRWWLWAAVGAGGAALDIEGGGFRGRRRLAGRTRSELRRRAPPRSPRARDLAVREQVREPVAPGRARVQTRPGPSAARADAQAAALATRASAILCVSCVGRDAATRSVRAQAERREEPRDSVCSPRSRSVFSLRFVHGARSLAWPARVPAGEDVRPRHDRHRLPTPPPTSPPPHKRRPRYRGTHPRKFEEKYKELARPSATRRRSPTCGAAGQNAGGGQHVALIHDGRSCSRCSRPEAGASAGSTAPLGIRRTCGARARAPLTPGGTLLSRSTSIPLELPRSEARPCGRARSTTSGRCSCGTRTSPRWRACCTRSAGPRARTSSTRTSGSPRCRSTGRRAASASALDGPLDMRMNPEPWSVRRGVARARHRKGARRRARGTRRRAARALPRPRARARARHARHDARLAKRRPPRAPETRGGGGRAQRAPHVPGAAHRGEPRARGRSTRGCAGCPRACAPAAAPRSLTFHSGEDRRVKHAFQQGLRDGTYAAVNDEVIRPSPAEQRSNPRSSPAKLRWARRA